MKYFMSWPFVLAFISLSCVGCSRPATDDKVINVSGDDPEMNAAIASARATLPDFWKRFENPASDEKQFALKVEIKDAKETEHFWAIEIEKKDGKIFGTINNDPDLVKNVKIGDRVEIPEDRISDWMFVRKGKMVGNYTVRPLLKKMPKDEAKKLKAMMESPP